MVKLTVVTCVLLAAAFRVAAGPMQGSLAERLNHPEPVIVAHRGCYEFGPEDSLKALRACFPLGVEMSEADVRATKDGVLVVMHDATLDRMTNLTGPLNRVTDAELRRARLRMGSGGKDAAVTDEPVPRLEDLLKAARGRIFLILHIKEPFYDRIYSSVAKAGMQDRTAFLIEAPPADVTLRQAKFLGRSALIPVVSQCNPAAQQANCYALAELGRAFDSYRPLHPTAYLVDLESNAALERSAGVIRGAGAKILAAGEAEERLRDPDAIWGPLLRLQVSLILTDRASELAEYLKTRDEHRVVPLERGSNFRDLGGYPAAGGKHVRWRSIYRSAATPMLSDGDVATIQRLGLVAMIDLRSTEERELAPTRLAGLGIRYVAIDYPFKEVPQSYADALVKLAPQFREIFRELLTQVGPISYNCTAGEDRTGIATALILSALGVPRAKILQDYHLSTLYRRPEYEVPRIDPAQHPNNSAAALLAEVSGSTPSPLYAQSGRSLLADLFDDMDAKWGSVNGYLEQVLGVGPAQIAALRAAYLE